MNIPVPKRRAEIVIKPLNLDPVQGWQFVVVCDIELHHSVSQMHGVLHAISFESGSLHITIDPRYSAHEVYVYVGCELTAMSKEEKLMRAADEVIKKT